MIGVVVDKWWFEFRFEFLTILCEVLVLHQELQNRPDSFPAWKAYDKRPLKSKPGFSFICFCLCIC